jgi:Txe/YoeB family toxin of toxin-antitoxin system
MYTITYSRQATKDKDKLAQTPYYEKAKQLIEIIKNNPFQDPPKYEQLKGDHAGTYSRRINIQHRIWYIVNESAQSVYIMRLMSHYER